MMNKFKTESFQYEDLVITYKTPEVLCTGGGGGGGGGNPAPVPTISIRG